MAIRRSDGVTAEPPLAQDTVIAVERIEMDGSADLYAAASAGVRQQFGIAHALGIGATLASHRGRGAQSALLARRTEPAIRDGCTLVTTETGVPHPGEPGPSYANINAPAFAWPTCDPICGGRRRNGT
jgi:hypothetical protein